MRAVYLLALCLGLLLGGTKPAARGDDLPPAVKETLEAFEKEVAQVQKKIEEENQKVRQKTADKLKTLQDKLTREAKLDEALAVRDLLRQFQAGKVPALPADLPAAAKEVLDAFDRETTEVQKKAESGLKTLGEKASGELKTLQDKLTREGKLDEALAIRDARKRFQIGAANVQADPGYFSAEPPDIGKVFYFKVLGNAGGSTWGTGVYTTDSHLATSAVHAGVLAIGQEGIVKVTVLPGQESYQSSERNGVTSHAWNKWHVSFKVERALGLAVEKPKE